MSWLRAGAEIGNLKILEITILNANIVLSTSLQSSRLDKSSPQGSVLGFLVKEWATGSPTSKKWRQQHQRRQPLRYKGSLAERPSSKRTRKLGCSYKRTAINNATNRWRNRNLNYELTTSMDREHDTLWDWERFRPFVRVSGRVNKGLIWFRLAYTCDFQSR